MENPLAEVLAHREIEWYDRIFDAAHDIDVERGMQEEGDYYAADRGDPARLERTPFKDIWKKYCWTQRGPNHLFAR